MTNKFDEMREYLRKNKQFEGIPLPMDTGFIDAMERIANNSTDEQKKEWIRSAAKMMEEKGQNIVVIGLWKMMTYDMFGLNKEDLREELNSIDKEKIKKDVEELRKNVHK